MTSMIHQALEKLSTETNSGTTPVMTNIHHHYQEQTQGSTNHLHQTEGQDPDHGQTKENKLDMTYENTNQEKNRTDTTEENTNQPTNQQSSRQTPTPISNPAPAMPSVEHQNKEVETEKEKV